TARVGPFAQKDHRWTARDSGLSAFVVVCGELRFRLTRRPNLAPKVSGKRNSPQTTTKADNPESRAVQR
ncbi:MAG: hypothetical protein AAFY31_07190, partial [Pseudomonadota bacterium]